MKEPEEKATRTRDALGFIDIVTSSRTEFFLRRSLEEVLKRNGSGSGPGFLSLSCIERTFLSL